jgi:hypothetical protein
LLNLRMHIDTTWSVWLHTSQIWRLSIDKCYSTTIKYSSLITRQLKSLTTKCGLQCAISNSYKIINVHPCVAENPMCRNDFMVWGS